MPRLFVPLDVEFSTDDKILAAGPLAAYLYICSLAFCKRNDKDGVVSSEQLVGLAPNLTGKAKLADRLVEVGLWHKIRNGWTIPAWTKHNKPAETIAYEREQKRLASMKANHTRHHTDGKTSGSCLFCDPITPPTRTPNRSQVGTDVGGSTEDVHPPKGKGEKREGRENPQGEGATEPVPLADAIVQWRGKPREEDLWDALAHELGPANTEPELDNRGKTRTELDRLGATPADVHARCREYRQRYPNAALTDAALLRHWSSLAVAKVVTPNLNPASQALVRAAQRRGIGA